MAAFHDLMGGALGELKLHARYAASLGIDLMHVRPHPETLAYTDFLMRLAWHDGLDVTVAGMTPCMRLYAWLGDRLRRTARPGPDHPYGDWIRTYAGPEFHALALQVEELLDAVARDTPPVRAAYRYAMACERDFFAAAYTTSTAP